MKSCITEYDEEAERKFLKNEGRAEGRKLEAERMDKLVSELLKANRIDDLKKATSDSEFKSKLFREFNL